MKTGRVLLTFTGSHDPFSASVVDSLSQAGPVLSMLQAMSFDHIYLFDTPGMAEQTQKTVVAIGKSFPDTNISTQKLSKLKNPTDHAMILRYLRQFLAKIVEKHKKNEFFISISSGTPAMHACWLLLVADGTIPARIFSGYRPPNATAPCRIEEIDLSKPEFPHIEPKINPTNLENDAEMPNLDRICEELGIIGQDPPFLTAIEQAARLAPYSCHLLILGETGTGKEQFARLIHRLSGRPNDLFVPVNCASLPASLAESMLFGHKKGSFTGAQADQSGEFDHADGGTLFLDEIGDLDRAVQAKLLRILQDGMIRPLGAKKGHKVDVRIVAATNVNLTEAIKEKSFRPDLAQRFAATIELPALRQRRADMVKLATFALLRWQQTTGQTRKFSRKAIEKIQQYDWPGNVRELLTTVERSAMLSRKQLIERALEITKNNQRQAAKLLGISPQAINKSRETA